MKLYLKMIEVAVFFFVRLFRFDGLTNIRQAII